MDDTDFNAPDVADGNAYGHCKILAEQETETLFSFFRPVFVFPPSDKSWMRVQSLLNSS